MTLDNSYKLVSVLSPSMGRLYTVQKGKKPVETICFNPITGEKAGWLNLIAWPYSYMKFKLVFTKEVTDIESARLMKKEDGVTPLYDSLRPFHNSSMAIGTRIEIVPFFKELENHPFVIESLSAIDGVSSDILINIIVRIKKPEDNGPLKILALLPDPFTFIFGYLKEALVSWANSMDSKTVRRITTDETSKADAFKEIKIKDEYYLKYLNREVFEKYDLEVVDVNLSNVFISASSKKVLEAEQGVPIAASEAEAAEEKAKGLIFLTKAKDKENMVALKFIKGELEAKEKFVNEISEALAKVNKGYGSGNPNLTTLIVNPDPAISNLIAAIKASNA